MNTIPVSAPRFRSPSITSIESVFPGKGKEAKAIFRMRRSELELLPAGNARVRECYHAPSTSDVRLHCLDALLETFGIEAFQTRNGTWVEYLNTGDTYALTIVRMNGHYRIASWGNIAESNGSL
jgi:hypothetical protein